ncbi:hypothetical protein [Carnobacterium inhibens]|uniref:hypothetical protein n=1 Tax=Carnobacterium inhibens TaxID=147709 RepID=UPI002042483B|nr:hypothetical protein [Carnobacterium inhibens]MCM3512516.1 hypothetical protein [Carnobacterium inhibens]
MIVRVRQKAFRPESSNAYLISKRLKPQELGQTGTNKRSMVIDHRALFAKWTSGLLFGARFRMNIRIKRGG